MPMAHRMPNCLMDGTLDVALLRNPTRVVTVASRMANPTVDPASMSASLTVLPFRTSSR